MKNVLIKYDLFYLLLRFHLLEDEECAEEIKRELEAKLNSLINHDLYTKSKKAPSVKEREQARKEYLESREIKQDFRW